MAIKRYMATADTTITNAFQSDLQTRGTGSNMGASDALEVFSIYKQATTITSHADGGKSVKASQEYARTLVKFTSSLMVADRSGGVVPSDAVYYLRLYNVPHGGTLPTNYSMDVYAIDADWDEGVGLDMEEYKDKGAASWVTRLNTPSTYATGSITVSVNPATGDTVRAAIGGYWVDAEAGVHATNTATALSSALAANSNIASLVDIGQTAGMLDITASAAAGNNITLTISASSDEGNGTLTKSANSLTGAYDYTNWTAEGGDMRATKVGTFDFVSGTEDMLVNVTTIVGNWVSGTTDYGFLIKLSQSYEEEPRSYYTKKFSGRGTEYWFQRPTIEARWDSSKTDDRANFYASSSMRSDNANLLYLYNYQDGTLINLPGSPTVLLKVYSDSDYSVEVTDGTASNDDTGLYSASITFDSTASTAYVKWYQGSTTYHTESISVSSYTAGTTSVAQQYVISLSNLKQKYTRNEDARFRLYTRLKDWSPTIYTVASKTVENNIIPNAFYKVERLSDELTVVDYGTGSTNHTKLSYDKDGNYFDFDMSLLESGYSYGIKFMFYLNGEYREQPEVFKFRVV